jgi:hypothetical protein
MRGWHNQFVVVIGPIDRLPQVSDRTAIIARMSVIQNHRDGGRGEAGRGGRARRPLERAQ